MSPRLLAVVCAVYCCWTVHLAAQESQSPLKTENAVTAKPSPAPGTTTPEGVLSHVNRKIGNEPKYVSTPQYALLVFGSAAESRAWMVLDGNVLYVDKNANGDLTDDGPPLEQSKFEKFFNGKNKCFQCEYTLPEIAPQNRPPHTEFKLRRWNYGDASDSYGLSVTLDGQTPMYAGWFGTFWSDAPADVPLVHFGGPLQPKLLRFKQLAIGSQEQRLSIAFVNPGSRDGAMSRLSIDALPAQTVLEVEIDWPTAKDDQAVRTTHRLTERCCYWEFYDSHFNAPPAIVPGTARATIKVPADTFPFELTTNSLEFPVVSKDSAQAQP